MTSTRYSARSREKCELPCGAFIRKNGIGYGPGSTVGQDQLQEGLRRSQTLQFLGIQYWQREVAHLGLNMSDALFFRIHQSVRHPRGRKKSLAAHNDFQCSFMTQLQGQKRWRLWHKPALHLPISSGSSRVATRTSRSMRPNWANHIWTWCRGGGCAVRAARLLARRRRWTATARPCTSRWVSKPCGITRCLSLGFFFGRG